MTDFVVRPVEPQYNLPLLLASMIELAASRHAHQLDKGGQPYILHVLKVMHYVKSDDLEVKMIAVGHDLIEDTFEYTYEGANFLSFRGFPKRVIDGILALTKVKGETYEAYQQKVLANRDACLVKMADLRHNSDIRRLKGITEKDIVRIHKYHKFYLMIKERLESGEN